jgi:hypothetical protein
MIWLKQNWFKISLLIILVISIAAIFYWYLLRPSIIRKDCYNQATVSEENMNNPNPFLQGKLDYDTYYERCLEKNGL